MNLDELKKVFEEADKDGNNYVFLNEVVEVLINKYAYKCPGDNLNCLYLENWPKSTKLNFHKFVIFMEDISLPVHFEALTRRLILRFSQTGKSNIRISDIQPVIPTLLERLKPPYDENLKNFLHNSKMDSNSLLSLEQFIEKIFDKK